MHASPTRQWCEMLRVDLGPIDCHTEAMSSPCGSINADWDLVPLARKIWSFKNTLNMSLGIYWEILKFSTSVLQKGRQIQILIFTV